MVMYANEFETKENKILTKDKIEPQRKYSECQSLPQYFSPLR